MLSKELLPPHRFRSQVCHVPLLLYSSRAVYVATGQRHLTETDPPKIILRAPETKEVIKKKLSALYLTRSISVGKIWIRDRKLRSAPFSDCCEQQIRSMTSPATGDGLFKGDIDIGIDSSRRVKSDTTSRLI